MVARPSCPRVDSTGAISSTTAPVPDFLQLELTNALNLVQTVHTSLAGLSRSYLRGLQPMTLSLYRLAGQLVVGDTPEEWLASWPEGPEQPVHFLRELVAKTKAVQVVVGITTNSHTFTYHPGYTSIHISIQAYKHIYDDATATFNYQSFTHLKVD
ncbi:unnamed protein product [Protopolystoma xenopodis]|uniref:Dynein heavy chain C-terminal domain-containing protein n=1 Tax=Protopolystoma xenopodis TaxID=117903 RepID=A0A448WJV7_9PLAT|nr:unnamed protein product [Protopolystoma xenopodis]